MRPFLLALICAYCSLAHSNKTLDQVIAATPKYDLAVTLLPDSHRMEVKGTLLLPPSERVQESIELELSELMPEFQAEISLPRESAGPVTLSKELRKGSNESHYRWILRLTRPVPAHQAVQIRFSYSGGSQGFVFYLGPEGSYAGGSNTRWYPQLAEEERGCGHLSFSVPLGYSVVATGGNVGTPAQEAQGHFEFEDRVPSQFSFAAAKYTVFRRDGTVPMRAYLLHPRPNVDSYLDGCSRVLAVLTKKFGEYPFAEFAIAEVPSAQAHQTGFSGASMNGFMLASQENLDEPFNLAYYGHEIGHQWWGNSVTVRGDDGEYMLSEAMAQFGSLYAVETLDGTVAAEEYRRSGYPNYSNSQCGYGYLRTAEAGGDQPLGSMKSGTAHELADSKGFLVWDLLANTIGRQRFDEVLQSTTRKYAFQEVKWRNFLSSLEGEAGQDLSWFYSQWFERKGAPNWQISWQQIGGEIRGTITQSAPFYRSKLEIEVRGINGETATHILQVSDANTAFHWPTAFQARDVVLDPHFRVLHWTPELRAQATALGPILHADYLCDTKAWDEAEALLRKALENVPLPDKFAARFWAEQDLARVFIGRKNWQEAQAHLDAALMSPTRDETRLSVVYYYYAVVAKQLKDDIKLHWAIDATAGSAVHGYAETLLSHAKP